MNIGKAIVYLEHIKPDDFNLDEQQTWNRLKAIQCLIQKFINQQEIIDKAIEDLKFYQSKAYDEEDDIRYDEIQSTIDILEDKEVK